MKAKLMIFIMCLGLFFGAPLSTCALNNGKTADQIVASVKTKCCKKRKKRGRACFKKRIKKIRNARATFDESSYTEITRRIKALRRNRSTGKYDDLVDLKNRMCLPKAGIKTAVKDLPPGWTQDVLYSNTFASPVCMTKGKSGFMYVNDRTDSRIIRLSKDGTYSVWATTTVGMDAIAYQPNLGRLIGSSGTNVYRITPKATKKIGTFSDNESAAVLVVDPRDDSIFTSSWSDNDSIRHYDKHFTLLETITAVNYCRNIALDTASNILYYTQDLADTVTALNLSSGESQIIRENLGGGFGSASNLGVTIDDNGIVYYSSISKGLFRYDPSLPEDNRETRIMDIPLGVGSIYWWPAKKIILQTNVFVGSLVKLDPAKTEPEFMEPNVNTPAIIATSDGTVYFYSLNQLNRLSKGKLTAIGSPLEQNIHSIALDHEERLYLAMDRFLYRVNMTNGEIEQWTTFNEDIIISEIEYDFKRNEMVVLSASEAEGKTIAKIWRVATQQQGATPVKKVEISLVDSEHTYLMVDRNKGDIYFYNRLVNRLARLDENTGTLITLIENALDDSITALSGFNFFSHLDSFLVTDFNSGRLLLALDGTGQSLFCTMAFGMDNQQGYEAANGQYYATNAGIIYRIRPE